MTDILLQVTYALISVVLIAYAVKSFKKKAPTGYYLGHVFACSTLATWAYALNLFCDSQWIKEFCASLQHVFIAWSLYFIAAFMFKLEGKSIHPVIRKANLVILGVDTVLLATNPVNHFTAEYAYRVGNERKLAVMSPKMFFVFHAFVCLAMIGTMIISMVRKIVATSSYYRSRYSLTIGITILIFALNTLFTINNESVYDYSIFLYGIAALLYYFSTFDYTPTLLLRRLQRYLDNSITDATILFDFEGNLLQANARARSVLSAEEMATKAELKALLGIEKEGTAVVELAGGHYEVKYEELYDDKSHYVAAAFVCHDVTESVRQLEREHRAAIFDPLTGCYNRLGFVEQAPAFLRENDIMSGYAVMVSGICDFKGINGLYGTRAGDKVLVEIARRFHEYHHEFPMLYGRTAEGKFACMLPFDHVDEIVNEMSHIRVNLDDNAEIHVDMCHGFVVVQDESLGLEYYYELSLLALARCKTQMNSPVLEYSADMADERKRKQMLLGAMHDSIDNREFFIELQPQIDLKENKVCGAEALVRWNHPTMGRISPAEFIPLFEGNGFIARLDQYVWNEAAKTIRRLSEAHIYEGPISVNVSQIDIMCMDVAGILKKIAEDNEIPTSKLHVEITESACVNNRKVLISTLEKLREAGFIVEIDDFGSGYSSLNALMKIPFDVVKLDMMFMKETDGDNKNDVILSAMSGMIHDLKAKIIVEGVETDENVVSAIHFNGDAAQGYHYSKPIPIEKFIDFVKKYNDK